jgi:uncharacterized protein
MPANGYKTREKDLLIKKSCLPKAGKGLFTRIFIARGELITAYKGTIRTWKKITENEVFNGYVFYINRNHVVDAMQTKKAPGRYANDAKGLGRVNSLRNNSEYIVRGEKVFIRAIKDIPAGAEILVDYGKEYWDVIKYNNKLRTKKAKKQKTPLVKR